MSHPKSHKVRSLGDTWVHVVEWGHQLIPDQPVIAVNWFNTRSLWLYHIYNLLASAPLKRVGGKSLFKGRLRYRIHGDSEAARSTVLLVFYPSVQDFLRLMGNRYFAFVGLLRMLAVRDFTFGLTQPVPGTNIDFDDLGDKQYICQYANSATDGLSDGNNQSSSSFYSGQVVATIATGDETRPVSPVPCLMSHFDLADASSVAVHDDSSLFSGIFERID